ncbi:DEAD/DEAH box helicase [Ectobacillus polymachus]|uniref:DEAD/DEAH box helicase n=1 Tax=Ectobacillus polymachus TaxID=1508806 RepID=UPI003A89B5D2
MIEQMKPFLQKAWESAGFQEMTTIQKTIIPAIIEGKDVMAESPTGTGKTLAYVLPLLQKVDETAKQPQIIILAPTRELVMQIQSEVTKFTNGSGITSVSLIGGADVKRQIEKLKKHPQIIVGSPGRILELIRQKKLKMHEVKAIVFDEYDQMLKQDTNLTDIVKTTLRDRQLIFVSATIPTAAEEQAKKMANELEVFRVKRKVEANVQHLYVVVPLREKIDTLRRILHMDGVKALAFLNDPFRLNEMERKLTFGKIAAAALHSEAKSQERRGIMQAFKQGKLQVVLATDVAARGLDIEDVTHVIHMEAPTTAEQYIHRSGRTGRMGKNGTVVSIITKDQEKALLQLGKKLALNLKQVEVYKGAFTAQRPSIKSTNSKKPR